jgi:hypothetical protein
MAESGSDPSVDMENNNNNKQQDHSNVQSVPETTRDNNNLVGF